MLLSERNVTAPTPERARESLQAQALADIRRAAQAAIPSTDFPDLIGLTLRQAMVKIPPQAKKFEVKGHGLVIRTVPPAGTLLDDSLKTVKLILENPD